ncbi:MAG: exopolysaccharide Pel transporter PelG, partial [Verrucomicrobiota bacterium]|nr:exopolysaccharide Pel transporter PelG [Verrucomicrobiota bacterium]
LIGTFFYTLFTNMDRTTTIFSIVNFVLLAEVWLAMLYLGCIRNFRAITISWIGGMILTIFLTIALGRSYGVAGMLAGLDAGLILLLALLQGNIFAEYPYPFRLPKEYGFYFSYYKGLFWSGLFLNAGMWIDKVIMWSAHEAIRHENHLITYPSYDGAMFIAYLSVIPAAAYFIYSLETNFYQSYIQYIENVERNAPLEVLESTALEMAANIKQNGRTMVVMQGCFALILIAAAPQIFEWAGFNFTELAIFRFGVLGSFFAILNLFLVILFSYFDNQARMVVITATMLATNVGLTLLTKFWGFPYYGLGFCLSMIITFALGALLLVRFLSRFTYHIFISNVVKRRYAISAPANAALSGAAETR